MTEFYSRLVEITGKENVKTEEPLSRYTTFKIGGCADYIVEPIDGQQIAAIIDLCKSAGIDYFVLGNGSNILVSDQGYKGVIIHIQGNMNRIDVDGDKLIVGAGALLNKVSFVAKDNGLAGMEFASGIPGTMGGAVYMNAGAYGGEMKDIVESVKVVDEKGDIVDIPGSDMDFAYRHSLAEERELVIIEATLKLKAGDVGEIDREMKRLMAQRLMKQPLDLPSAGSTFKRPEGYFAGKLIMDAGLRGVSVGGAQVSEKHCGFVVNKGGATAEDVTNLIKLVKDKVLEEFNVELEPEVNMLGF